MNKLKYTYTHVFYNSKKSIHFSERDIEPEAGLPSEDVFELQCKRTIRRCVFLLLGVKTAISGMTVNTRNLCSV